MYKNCIVFENDSYRINDVRHRLKTFDSLTDARKEAKKYTNAYVVRLYYANDSGDYLGYKFF